MKRDERLLTITSSLLATLLLALGACAATGGPQTPAAPEQAGRCDAAKAQFAVGQEHGLALQEQTRERTGARIVRTLRPGQIVTMEYSAERLNLELDAAGRVARVRCG